MWKTLIRQHWAEHQFFPAASTQQVDEAGKQLGVELPEDLRQLLLESDGVHGPHGLGLIWSIDRLLKDNVSFRTNEDFRELYMSFHSLMFFADAGNGDQFAFSVHNGRIRKPDIYVWNHEDDSRVWVASSLRQYIECWASGEITL
jgi:hypothetical protein